MKLVKKQKTWRCYYLAAGGKNPSEHVLGRKMTFYDYFQPQRGGQFYLNATYMKMYANLIDNMTSEKYNSAFLITKLKNVYKLSI